MKLLIKYSDKTGNITHRIIDSGTTFNDFVELVCFDNFGESIEVETQPTQL